MCNPIALSCRQEAQLDDSRDALVSKRRFSFEKREGFVVALDRTSKTTAQVEFSFISGRGALEANDRSRISASKAPRTAQPLMCFVKTEDPTWPHIFTVLPRNSPRENERNPAVKRRNRPAVRTLDEVHHFRAQPSEGNGQTAIHLACQLRPEDEPTIRLLAESDHSTLLTRDATGDIPIMTAIKNGCSLSVLSLLTAIEPSSLYCKNFVGKTPLLLAVEFACATVQSVADTNASGNSFITRRMPHTKGNPKQIDEDIKALQVVAVLMEEGPLALDMGDNCDTTPLHALSINNGPGRLSTLEAMVCTLAAPTELAISHERPRYIQWSYFCKRCRNLDGSTPLHLACDPKHFDPELAARLIELDPDSVLLKNSNQQTSLHLLSNPTPMDKQRARRTLLTAETRNACILKMIAAQPKVLRIRDGSNRLPLHCYMESMNGESCWRADPLVVQNMLTQYHASAWIPNPKTGSIVFSAVIACMFSQETNQIQPPEGCQHDLEDDLASATVSPSDVDPTLLILWIVLSFGVFSNEKELLDPKGDINLTKHSEDALNVVQVFLQHIPLEKWILLHPYRYANNLRCVLRLIANAFFSARYRSVILSKGRPAGGMAKHVLDEEMWVAELWDHWKRVDNTTLEASVVRVVNCIYRENDTVAKVLALPEERWDSDFTVWMFPTMTPAVLQESHRFCPIYKPLVLFKYSKSNDIDAFLNMKSLNHFLRLIPHDVFIYRSSKGRSILGCGVFTDETVQVLQERIRIGKLALTRTEEDNDDNEDEARSFFTPDAATRF